MIFDAPSNSKSQFCHSFGLILRNDYHTYKYRDILYTHIQCVLTLLYNALWLTVQFTSILIYHGRGNGKQI